MTNPFEQTLAQLTSEHQAHVALIQQRNQRLQFKYERLQKTVKDYLNGKVGASTLKDVADE